MGVFSSNFLFGILFMPAEQRRAVTAIYGFCRAADDAADLDPARGAERVAYWREELAQLYRGAPRDPVTKALFPFLGRYRLKREYFERLLAGMEMDLARCRYENMEELAGYCDRVAGAVGLLCLQVAGLHDDPRAREYSDNLSRGLQLTNIIRDVHADVAIDRVYFPQEDFGGAGYTEAELKKGVVNIGYFTLVRFTVGRARGLLEKAARLADGDLRRRLLGPEIMRETYLELLDRMSHVLDECLDGDPPRLSFWARLSIGVSVWIRSRLRG